MFIQISCFMLALLTVLGIGRLNGWLFLRAGWKAMTQRYPGSIKHPGTPNWRWGGIFLRPWAYLKFWAQICVDEQVLHLRIPNGLAWWMGVPSTCSIPLNSLRSDGNPTFDGWPLRLSSLDLVFRVSGSMGEKATCLLSSQSN